MSVGSSFGSPASVSWKGCGGGMNPASSPVTLRRRLSTGLPFSKNRAFQNRDLPNGHPWTEIKSIPHSPKASGERIVLQCVSFLRTMRQKPFR